MRLAFVDGIPSFSQDSCCLNPLGLFYHEPSVGMMMKMKFSSATIQNINTSIIGMKKIVRTFTLMMFLFATFCLAGCVNNTKKDFNKLLMELAGKDQTIDHDDWIAIENYLDGQKVHFKDLYQDGLLNKEAVQKYIEDFFSHRRDSGKISFIGMEDQTLNVHFYLERSGSMIAYDSPSGDGSFKAAIVQMLNNLPGNNVNNKIYVVNSSIQEYPQGFNKFVKDNNIFEATKGIGDPSYTDFGAIFNQILNKTKDDEISILATDMIYSTKDMAGVNPQKVFAEAQGMTNAIFKDEVKKKSMLVIQLTGSYNGPYYPYNSPSRGENYNGKRPYYFVIVGNNDNIARLTTDHSYDAFSRFSQLRGYEDMYLFETDDVYNPYYSLLLNHQDIRGRFQPERGQDSQIKNLEGVAPDRNSGDIRLVLAVDLSKMLIDRNYLTDVKNYEISSDDKIVIKEIRPISKTDMTPAEKKYIGSATHLFILEMNELKHDQDIEIKLLNKMPSWVEQSSSDDDTHVDGHTTFGLKYLLQGIYDSYRKNSDGKPYYFKMEFKFKK